jgi:hypothetical protein
MSQAGVVNVIAGSPFIGSEKVIDPHNPTNSMIYIRLSEPAHRMPPIGSRVLDESALELVNEWINALPDGAFSQYEVGGGTLRGSVAQQGGVRLVSGVGAGLGFGEDRLHFLARSIKRSAHVVARISGINGAQPGMRAGVMMRESSAADAATVWLGRGIAGTNVVSARVESAAEAGDVAVGQTNKPWLRLVRNGSVVAAWESADRVQWDKLGETDFLVSEEALAGVAVASGEDWRYATAAFDELQTLSVSLNVIDSRPGAPLPHDITLQAEVETSGVSVTRVDFVADGRVVGTAAAAPWSILWTNAPAGTYSILARATDSNGLSVESEPHNFRFTADQPMARFLNAATVDADWSQTFGGLGRAIPGLARELPESVRLDVPNDAVRIYAGPGMLPNADSTLSATAWRADGALNLFYSPGNEVPHRLTLFFAPHENAGPLKVTFRDAGTGAKVAEQIVTNFEAGLFHSWAVRGQLAIEIESTLGQAAHLTGVFLDTLAPPVVRLDPIESVIMLPSTILLKAEAHAEGREITRVEFWDGSTKIGEDTAAPYELTWTNPLAGEHTIIAWAVGEFGLGMYSEPIYLRCTLPSASVTFVGEDRSTRGEWIGPYGNIGQVIPAGWTNLPPQLTVEADALTWVFGFPTSVPGSLRVTLDSDELFAGCYFVNADVPLTMQISALDAHPTRLSLYFHDWLGPGRAEQIQILDAATAETLDTREITSFTEGAYLTWNIRGQVRVVIRSRNDYNTIVSAIFFDPPESLAGFWFRERFPGSLPLAAKWGEDPDDDGRPNLLEYAAGSDPLTEDPAVLHSATLADGMFHVRANLGVSPSDARILLETSADLVNWENSGATLENGSYDVPYRLPATDASARFFRLRAELIGN